MIVKVAALIGTLAAMSAASPMGATLTKNDMQAEGELLAAHADHVRREGDRLEIHVPRNTKPAILTDRSCAQSEDGDCIEFRLDAAFPRPDRQAPPVFGVSEGYYEGSSYVLYSTSGETIETGERPIPSPDGKWLAAAAWSDSHPPYKGLTLVRVGDDGYLTVVRTIPMHALTAYQDFRWVGSDCLAFRASVFSEDGFAYGPQKDFRLVRDVPEWRLLVETTDCRTTAGNASAIQLPRG